MDEQKAETTAPQVEAKTDTVVVKFNKQTRELPLKEAAELAQKGLKYEQILPEFERLRRLAGQDSQTVPAFLDALESSRTAHRRADLEQLAVAPELIERILTAEGKNFTDDRGFAELQEQFPEIARTEDLPESVRTAAEQKGTRLLDEYLRYRLAQQKAGKCAEKNRRAAEAGTVGSMRQPAAEPLPLAAEFLRGVWAN